MGVVVVGGGIAGMSVAAELARDRDVLLVEGERELARHTTGRSAASYIPGHGAAPARALVAASRDRFAALAEEAGHSFLRPRAVLHVAQDDDEERMLREEILTLGTVDELTVAEAVRRWPALRADRVRAAGVVEDAQDADPLGLHEHYRRTLRARGGEIRTGAPVTALHATATGWRVGIGDDHVDTDTVVLAAGAWTDRLLTLAGAAPIGLRPLRRTIAIARVPDGAPVRRDDPFAVSVGEHWYAKPEGEYLLISPSEETPAEPGDPRPEELDVARALEAVNDVTTLGLRSVVTSWTGLRTFAPDRSLVIGDRPEHPGLHLFAGQGGSGIETAPAAAVLAAAVITGADPPADVVAALEDHGAGLDDVLARRIPDPRRASGSSSLASPRMGDARRLLAAAVAVLALVLAGCGGAGEETPPPSTIPTAGAPIVNGAGAGGPLAPLPPEGSREGQRICGKFQSVPVAGGRYEVQNNAWGATTPQCTTAFDTGFSVQASHDKDSGPAAYPSIVVGCNYGTCTRDAPFPRPLADLGDVRSSWAVTVPRRGDYNVAYDVWLDPTPRRDGANTGAELMIWLDRTDRVQPIGSKRADVEIGDARWEIWQGENEGLPVISYVREESTTTVLDLPISDFITDATRRGVVEPSWFLTNVQAGFEPWIGGEGLSTDAFALTRNGV